MPILILVIGLFAAYIDLFPNAHFMLLTNTDGGFGQPLETKLGLDLKGGYELRYTAQPKVVNGTVTYPSADDMATIRTIVENRVNGSGVVEPIVDLAGKYDVIVQVPGASDPTQVAKLVGKVGELKFVLLPEDQYGKYGSTTGCPSQPSSQCTTIPVKDDAMDAALLATAQYSGSQLDPNSIKRQYNSSKNGWEVAFAFKDQYASGFATWTGNHVNDYFAIVLDGKVQSAPYIESALTGGKGVISGHFSADEAKQLVTVLQYGSLPFSLKEQSSRAISPTQAAFSLDQTLLAGGIGIGLVLIFMLIYYRLPGLIADFALAYYGLAVLALFRIVPVTLTLAGIAGFVLSIGMAVDANILIFERTKEELRTGKTLVAAVEAGFNLAWNSILDSNVSSLLTAFVLYMGGSPAVKGFALVLMLGVATSMFTAVTVSRTLLRFVVREEAVQKAWLFGVSDEEFQARAYYGRQPRREARTRV